MLVKFCYRSDGKQMGWMVSRWAGSSPSLLTRLIGQSNFKPAQRGNLYISACNTEEGQNLPLRGKCIPVTHCDNNLLQVGAGGWAWPAET